MKYKIRTENNKIVKLLENLYKINLLNNKEIAKYTTDSNVFIIKERVLKLTTDGSLYVYDAKNQDCLYTFSDVENRTFYTKILNAPLIQAIIEHNDREAFALVLQSLGCDIFNNMFNLSESAMKSFISSGKLRIYSEIKIIDKHFKSVINEPCQFYFDSDDFDSVVISIEGSTSISFRDVFNLRVPEEREQAISKMNSLLRNVV